MHDGSRALFEQENMFRTARSRMKILTLVCALTQACAFMAFGGIPPDAREGVIKPSKGEKIEGRIFMTRGKLLRVWDPVQQCYRDFTLKKLSRLTINVKQQRIEREWRFKEEGNAEKVYTGRIYPRLDFTMTLTLSDGKRLDCTIPRGQPIYVQPAEGKKKRFIIQPYLKGEPGQTPGDLVYLKEVVFDVKKPQDAPTENAPKAPPAPSQDGQ